MDYRFAFLRNESVARLAFAQVTADLFNEFVKYKVGDSKLLCSYWNDEYEPDGFEGWKTLERLECRLVDDSNGTSTSVVDIYLMREDTEDLTHGTYQVVINNINYGQYISVWIDDEEDPEEVNAGAEFSISIEVCDRNRNIIMPSMLDDDSKSILNIIMDSIGRFVGSMAPRRLPVQDTHEDDEDESNGG